MYYGSVTGFLQLTGTTGTSQNPTTACGYYNGMWGICSGWGLPGNYSLFSAMQTGVDPKLNTSQSGNNNINITDGWRYKDRQFSCNVVVINGGGAANVAGFGSPFGGAASLSNTLASAYKNQSMSNNQNYITTTGIPAYGYGFGFWRLESSSGTILTSTQTVSWFFNSSYGGKNFAYIKNLVAQFAVAGKPSDRKLKENIRLVGKSPSGINIYTWTYKNQERDGKGVFEGVIAQEVPQASIQHPDGYLMVDYSKIDVIFKKVYGSIMGN
tara:strand:+ start:561 stop:1367 length:807 start_codon:yes stop_codon:yes gene_type:complete